MAINDNKKRVFLDHLISRQSLRYLPKPIENTTRNYYGRPNRSARNDSGLRYTDISGEWFHKIRKPDFQRETNAWSPEQCAEFLDSVVHDRIIPSIILWRSEENGATYVLDGAHRLSVIKAWMADDWGDKAKNYYERRDTSLISEIARETRRLVQAKIGDYRDYETTWREREQLTNQGEAPKQIMSAISFARATFYADIVTGHQTLYVQWEYGDYASAEQSFLRINRQGQPLNDWESTLIEYRNSSYARTIMSIANGGESGHYWPQPVRSDEIAGNLAAIIASFEEKTAEIHKQLFVPPFNLAIRHLTVPLMIDPAYFQKHQYLLEIIPLVAYKQIAIANEQQIQLMKRDVGALPEQVIHNANELITGLMEGLEHLISPKNSSKSLSIVPLFYCYNQRGDHVRALLYGFVYWLLLGTKEDIAQRKLVFTINRGRFEQILFDLKADITEYASRIGAGLKATKQVANFYQNVIRLLHENPNLPIESEKITDSVLGFLSTQGRKKSSKAKLSRNVSTQDRNEVNIRELFLSATRCHICDGVYNLGHGGLQYDHVQDYANVKETHPDNLKPTHPFCNNHKTRISRIRARDESISLPSLNTETLSVQKVSDIQQLSLWADDFPT